MKRLFILFVLSQVICIQLILASNIDSVKVFSHSMEKDINTLIITPENYDASNNYSVIYLLHGYGDNHKGWTAKGTIVRELADKYNFIVVCPDGDTSWYFDSPIDSTYQYETFISKELVRWVDENYSTKTSRTARAITGLSMGGHGGLYVGIRNQDVFGACGSMSGGVDLRPFPNNWDIAKRLGSQSEYPQNWEENSVINLLHLVTPNSIKIIFDCGTDDFFYDVNVKLHNEMLYRNIQHDFISRPGGHTWSYWQNAVKYQFMFFDDYFTSK